MSFYLHMFAQHFIKTDWMSCQNRKIVQKINANLRNWNRCNGRRQFHSASFFILTWKIVALFSFRSIFLKLHFLMRNFLNHDIQYIVFLMCHVCHYFWGVLIEMLKFLGIDIKNAWRQNLLKYFFYSSVIAEHNWHCQINRSRKI